MANTAVLKSKYDAVDVLRFPLIVLVVFVHVIPEEIQMITLDWNPDALYTLFSELISHHLGRLAVPCFFLFSGYFFFLKIDVLNAKQYGSQLRSRLRTILLPYLIWNLLYILAILFKNYLFAFAGLPKDELYAEMQQKSWYYILWERPLLFPLWYLRDLICMSVLAPVFYLLFKSTKWFGLLLLLALYLLVLESGLPGLSTTALFFFGAGAFLGLYKINLMQLAAKSGMLKFFAALTFLALACYYSNSTPYEYWIRPFTVFGLLCLLHFGIQLTETTQLKSCLLDMAPSVFFIYAVHSIYIINWIKGAFASIPAFAGGYGKLFAYFIIPALCLCICYYLYKMMSRLFPGMVSVLTGGRKQLKP